MSSDKAYGPTYYFGPLPLHILLRTGVVFCFLFFFRMNLCGFIKVNQLHPNVKMKQHAMGHLLSILENLVCV